MGQNWDRKVHSKTQPEANSKDSLLRASRSHEVNNDEYRDEGDGECDSADKSPTSANAASFDRLVYDVEVPERQKGHETAEGDHCSADRKGHASGADVRMLLKLGGEFAQPNSEFCHDEAETDNGNACADPGEKSAL